MIENGQSRPDRLEQNLERLLNAAAPPLTMPEPVKERILGELTASGDVVTPMPRRRRRWLIAAAAAAAVMLIGLWPGNPPSGISWADVLERLSEVTTLRATLDAEGTTPSGEPRRFHSFIYEKDPGLYRSETMAAAGEIEFVTVLRRYEGGAEQLILFPRQRQAVRTSHVIRGTGDSQLPDRDRVADAWRRLGDIATSDAYRIGEARWNGRAAVGFEIPAEEFFDDRRPTALDGSVRLWADRETAVPVRIEVDFVDADGRRTNAVLTDIEWGIRLADELFELTVPEGWSAEETCREIVTYGNAKLAPSVGLRLAPENGSTLLTEADVDSVRSIESNESLTIDSPPSVVLTLLLHPPAGQRVEDFRSDHPKALLVVDFNSETRLVPGFEGPNLLRLDLSRLEKPLTGIEDTYIDTGNRVKDSAVGEIE